MTIRERLNEKRVAVLAVARSAHNGRMIGSVARGDARPDGDLDLLVELDRQSSGVGSPRLDTIRCRAYP